MCVYVWIKGVCITHNSQSCDYQGALAGQLTYKGTFQTLNEDSIWGQMGPGGWDVSSNSDLEVKKVVTGELLLELLGR